MLIVIICRRNPGKKVSYGFQNDSDTGLRNAGSDSLSITAGGISRALIHNVFEVDTLKALKYRTSPHKNVPIFIRAYENTKLLYKDFKIERGELFYYIFLNSIGKGSYDKPLDVIAFTPESINKIDKYKDKINWDEIIRRSIITKSDKIFEALSWDINMELSDQLTLF